MTLKAKLIYGYIAIGILVAIGTMIFGTAPKDTFAAGIGNGLVWPAVIIPGAGKVIGGIMLIGFLAAVYLV